MQPFMGIFIDFFFDMVALATLSDLLDASWATANDIAPDKRHTNRRLDFLTIHLFILGAGRNYFAELQSLDTAAPESGRKRITVNGYGLRDAYLQQLDDAPSSVLQQSDAAAPSAYFLGSLTNLSLHPTAQK
jgi:hypothetical protein